MSEFVSTASVATIGSGTTLSLVDDPSPAAGRVYVTGDGTERAMWALRSYVRGTSRAGDAPLLRRTT